MTHSTAKCFWRRILRPLVVDNGIAFVRVPDDKEVTIEMRTALLRYAMHNENLEDFMDWLNAQTSNRIGVADWTNYLRDNTYTNRIAGPLLIVMPYAFISLLIILLGFCLTSIPVYHTG